MSIAGGVSWEAVIRPLRAVSEFWGALFVFYISFLASIQKCGPFAKYTDELSAAKCSAEVP